MLTQKPVIATIAAVLALLGLAVAAPASVGAARAEPAQVAPAPIIGAGDMGVQSALNDWIANLAQLGFQVAYDGAGSDTGRTDYMEDLVDFAVSDAPYRHGRDKLGNVGPEETPLGYSYIPLTGGGVAFVYHLKVRGHLITNLRLSGRTIMKIFTGQVTNWDNPAITHDYGKQLPSIPIIPVVHAGSSGISYYLSNWLAREYPRPWNAFCDQVHRWIRPPCGPTEFYPQTGNAQAMSSSSTVAQYAATTEGAIGYDEYAYALGIDAPVVRVLNRAGRYVLPLAANVTAALSRAVINEDQASPDFLQENLDDVYADKNPISYPLSYYSYLIVPRAGTTLPPSLTPDKGYTISFVAYYALCEGQQYIGSVGFGPLPGALIRNGLTQVRRIPDHFSVPPLSDCHDLPH